MPEHVPTAEELSAMGSEYAVPCDWTKPKGKRGKPIPTRWRITDKGHALMGEAMRRNALEALERGEGRWVQPPSRRIPGLE